jgi:hypothetical protein
MAMGTEGNSAKIHNPITREMVLPSTGESEERLI